VFQIKICGITSRHDLDCAVAAGADAVGFNFFPSSPRCVSESTARQLATDCPHGVCRVGVFVNATPAAICQTFDAVGLDLVQLHGDETPDVVAQLAGWPVLKAIRLGASRDLEIAALEAPLSVPPWGILIDAAVPGAFGGTGVNADWTRARRFRDALAGTWFILAGGLTADNVAQAIAAVRPHGVDVASGVEGAPGIKDARRCAEFVVEARRAFEALARHHT
jgi:phosphoribosylanthranilate isomerase